MVSDKEFDLKHPKIIKEGKCFKKSNDDNDKNYLITPKENWFMYMQMDVMDDNAIDHLTDPLSISVKKKLD